MTSYRRIVSRTLNRAVNRQDNMVTFMKPISQAFYPKYFSVPDASANRLLVSNGSPYHATTSPDLTFDGATLAVSADLTVTGAVELTDLTIANVIFNGDATTQTTAYLNTDVRTITSTIKPTATNAFLSSSITTDHNVNIDLNVGLPDTTGKVLSSTTGGVLSWVTGGGGGTDPFLTSIKPTISYTSPVVYTPDEVIEPLTPTKGGYLPFFTNAVYSSSPSLPSNLSIDANTGIISGTAGVARPERVYTITALTTFNYAITFPITINITSDVFSPLSISGYTLWLDGQDPENTGVQPTAGDPVNLWIDKAFGYQLTNVLASGATYILNGGLLFSGHSGYSYASPILTFVNTIFIVFINNNDTGALYTTCGVCDGVSGFFPRSNGSSFISNGVGTWSTSESIFTANVIRMVQIEYSNTDVRVYNNNVNIITSSYTGAFSSNVFNLGFRSDPANPFSGSIFEMISYNRVLTSGERLNVQNYLTNKWNIV